MYFLTTGVSPVLMKETLAICYFIDGADKIKFIGGAIFMI